MDAEYEDYLRSPHWLSMRDTILARSGHRCEYCDSASADEVHHITYARKGNETSTDLLAVCAKCHSYLHGRSEMPNLVPKADYVKICDGVEVLAWEHAGKVWVHFDSVVRAFGLDVKSQREDLTSRVWGADALKNRPCNIGGREGAYECLEIGKVKMWASIVATRYISPVIRPKIEQFQLEVERILTSHFESRSQLAIAGGGTEILGEAFNKAWTMFGAVFGKIAEQDASLQNASRVLGEHESRIYQIESTIDNTLNNHLVTPDNMNAQTFCITHEIPTTNAKRIGQMCWKIHRERGWELPPKKANQEGTMAPRVWKVSVLKEACQRLGLFA